MVSYSFHGLASLVLQHFAMVSQEFKVFLSLSSWSNSLAFDHHSEMYVSQCIVVSQKQHTFLPMEMWIWLSQDGMLDTTHTISVTQSHRQSIFKTCALPIQRSCKEAQMS
jgi:hypothetical protein